MVIASIGGFVYLSTAISANTINQQDFELIYVLVVGFVLFILGFSVFMRLIKRHFDGKTYQTGIEKLRYTIKKRYEGTHLYSYYESMDGLNTELDRSVDDLKKVLDNSSWFHRIRLIVFARLHRDILPPLGGVGMVIGLINGMLMMVIFGYFFRFVIDLPSPDFGLYAFGIGGAIIFFQIGIYWSKKYVIDSAIKRWKDKSNNRSLNQESISARN